VVFGREGEMKILFTTDKLNRGGKEKQLLILANGLLNRNYDVFIISKNRVDPYDYYNEIGFPDERIFTLKNRGKRLFASFKDLIIKFDPDVTLSWSVITTLWLFRTKLSPNKLRIINCTLRQGKHYDRFKHRLLSQIAVKMSKYNISNSKAGLALFGLKENQNNIVIYNAFLNLKKKDDVPVSLNEVFNKQLKESDIVIANVGSLYKHKNQLSLIEALNELKDKRYHLMIIGEGDERKQLEKYITTNKLEQHVVLLGRKKEVLSYLEQANLYVNASSAEGCSNAIVEAMSCGLPIVSTPDGGTTEIAFPDTTQFFKFNNISELVNRIKNAPSKEDIDQNKLSQWLQKFDLEACIDKYENFIKKIAS
jgi:glycosyltransferase involved in cell wall biosynthesis